VTHPPLTSLRPVIDDFHFVGRPTLLAASPDTELAPVAHVSGSVKSPPPSSATAGPPKDKAKDKSKDELTMFNVVLVLDKDGFTESHAKVCRKIVNHLATALKHEQDRCGYLNAEVFKMLHTRYVHGFLLEVHD